jgi:hypothetical protein
MQTDEGLRKKLPNLRFDPIANVPEPRKKRKRKKPEEDKRRTRHEVQYVDNYIRWSNACDAVCAITART